MPNLTPENANFDRLLKKVINHDRLKSELISVDRFKVDRGPYSARRDQTYQAPFSPASNDSSVSGRSSGGASPRRWQKPEPIEISFKQIFWGKR